jgi:hypothetical protein
MASAVLFDKQPFDRMVRCRTVAKVLSTQLVRRIPDRIQPAKARHILDHTHQGFRREVS